MDTIKKRQRIVLCICSILVIVAIILSFIPLNKNNKMVVKADSVFIDYSYSGSNISSKTTFKNGLFSYNLFNAIDIPSQSSFINNDDGSFSVIDFTSYYKDINISRYINLELGKIYTFSLVLDSWYNSDDTSGSSELLLSFSNGVYDVFSFIELSSSRVGNSLYSTFTVPSDYGSIIDVIWRPIRKNNNTSSLTATISSVSIVEGNFNIPYQPYQNSTQINYEFDFNSSRDFDSSFDVVRIDLFSNISNNMDFTRVSNSDYSYNYGNSYSFSTNTRGVVTKLTYSAIDKNTNVLNNDYLFNLYLMVDYVDNPDFNPAVFFTADIGSIVLGSYLDYPTYFKNEYTDINNFISTEKYNFISYVDKYNNNLNIFIPLDSDIDSDYWQFRTYFVTDDTHLLFSAGYNSGYHTGYNNGFSDGETAGYSNGYTIGKNDGYNIGYNSALENDKYSFTALISSVIDVPVKTFTSLFNFEILGVNLSGFFLGLLTCCIVIGVVRLIL